MYRGGGGAAPGVRSSADVLLQRASSQLKGERVSSRAEEDDGLGAYLSGLGRTPSAQQPIQWDKFGDSDFSDDGADDLIKKKPAKTTSGGSKFLKKKRPAAAQQDENHNSVSNTKSTAKAKAVGATRSSTGQPGMLATQNKSSALNKVAAFTNRYERKREVAPLSESDMDLSLSMDDDVLHDVQNLRASTGPTTIKRSIRTPSPDTSSEGLGKGGSRFMKKKAAPVAAPRQSVSNYVEDDDEEESMQLGRGGSKFVKKKKTSFADEKPASTYTSEAQSGGQSRKPMYSLKSAEKYSTQVVLDTDEESIADYMQGMADSAPTTPRSLPRTPRGILKTPRTPRTPPPMEDIREEEEVSLRGEIRSEIRGEISSDEESDDSFKSAVESVDSDFSDTGFNVNLMDLDSLEPVMLTTEPKKTKDSKAKKDKVKDKGKDKGKKAKVEPKKTIEDDIFGSLGLHTVDELLGGGQTFSDQEISEVSDVEGGATSEIRTEADDQYESDFDPYSRSARSPTPLRSILSPTPRSTPRSARGRVRYNLQEVTEIRSRSPSPEVISTARGSMSHASIVYTDDFDDESASEIATATVRTEYESDSEGSEGYSRGQRSRRSRKDSDDYSDDFTSATDATSRRHYYSRSSSHDSDLISYTESFTSYDSDTRSRTPSPDWKPQRVKTRTANVQTGLDLGDLVYQWNLGAGGSAVQGPSYGLTGVDPTPIATHVVGADALEALTSYSPSVIALNDMLRQQLQLTTQFVETQRRLHHSMVSHMEPEFQYTTLEDTKRYIKKHKKKTLTFEEALKQVKDEMNLD